MTSVTLIIVYLVLTGLISRESKKEYLFFMQQKTQRFEINNVSVNQTDSLINEMNSINFSNNTSDLPNEYWEIRMTNNDRSMILLLRQDNLESNKFGCFIQNTELRRLIL